MGAFSFSRSLRCFHQYQHTMVISVTGTVVTTQSHHSPVTSNEAMLGVDLKMPALSTLCCFALVGLARRVWGGDVRR